MTLKNREQLKSKIRRLLSVDARISMQDLANALATTKVNAYALFNEVANDYSMRFVPEISIEKLWKWEFIKRARLRTKRGILAEAVEELPLTGFGEYIVFVKFVGKKPKDDELVKAMGNSYAPQFAARVKGDYDLVIYLVERSYEDAVRFTDTLSKNLNRYDMFAYTTRAWSSFGFFPLSRKLVEQFDIFDTYKNLLYGLIEAGRNTFTDIGKNFNQGPAQMLYAYDRLARTEILRRVTYFEQKPHGPVNMLVVVKTDNAKLFEESKEKWFARLAKEYETRENECVFMCDVPSPKGVLVFANFGSQAAANKFISIAKASLRGAVLSKMQISKALLGSMGIRDFDMRYIPQYRSLERKKLVPALVQKSAESVVENPNAL